MILVEPQREGMTSQRGMLSLENIQEFQTIESYLKEIRR